MFLSYVSNLVDERYKVIDGTQYYVLKEELIIDIIVGSSYERFVVPAGFITDFASTPKWSHFMFPPKGNWSIASVLHDYLYTTQEKEKDVADLLFFYLLVCNRVNIIVSFVFLVAVYVFGRFSRTAKRMKKLFK